jgi:hypothetical protein
MPKSLETSTKRMEISKKELIDEYKKLESSQKSGNADYLRLEEKINNSIKATDEVLKNLDKNSK